MSGVVHRGLESLGAVDERPPAVFLSESSTAQCLLGTRAPAVQFHWSVIIQGGLPVSTLGIHSLNGRLSAGAPLCPKCRPKKREERPPRHYYFARGTLPVSIRFDYLQRFHSPLRTYMELGIGWEARSPPERSFLRRLPRQPDDRRPRHARKGPDPLALPPERRVARPAS